MFPCTEALEKCGGNQSAAAKMMGLNRQWFRDRLAQEQAKATKRASFVALPDAEADIEEIIAERKRDYRRQKARRDAERWLPITVPETGPFGLMVFGDEHADDNNCDWEQLDRDLRLARETAGVYACAMGDATNNWVGRLMREYAEQSVTRSKSRTMLKWLLSPAAAPWLFRLIGNHDCVTPDHEVLTRRGWIKFPDVRSTDEVLGYNTETGKAEWQGIDEVVSFDYEGPLHTFKTSRFSIKATPNHRFLCHRFSNRPKRYPLEYIHARDLSSQFRVVNSAPVSATGARFSDAEIKLAAWILADGHINLHGYVSIYQSKSAGVAEIRTLLDEVGVEYVADVRERSPARVGNVAIKSALPQTVFRLPAHSSRRLRRLMWHKQGLPSWCFDMSPAQFDAFIGAYIRADGSEYGGARREGTAIIYGSERMLSDLQKLCIMNGWSASVRQDGRGAYRLNVCRRNTTDVAALASIERYEGKVWCLRVPLSNFMMRHEGLAHFTGNSWNEGDVLIGLFGGDTHYVAKWEARVELVAGGERFRIHASHDFKGSSIYNKTHGPSRAAMFSGGAADLYLCGHKHCVGTQSFEIEETRKLVHVARAASYKKHDSYAVQNGFAQGEVGSCLFVLFNPLADTPAGRITIFNDPVLGCKMLTALRAQSNPKRSKRNAGNRAVRAGRRGKVNRRKNSR